MCYPVLRGGGAQTFPPNFPPAARVLAKRKMISLERVIRKGRVIDIVIVSVRLWPYNLK